MPYCPKCGNKVDESMTFCPRCGASLKIETPTQAPPAASYAPQPPMRNEKSEKQEKNQQQPEKGEKHEKGEFGFVGFLIAGLVVLLIGVVAFLRVSGALASAWEGPITMLVIGFAIIIVGVYVATMARRRNPHAA
jgi:predicted lipid-binding transport protein (Tim44 family)